MLQVVYLAETKELLCANIITTNMISSDEQNQFIIDMCGVLWPEASKDSVISWVEDNTGSAADTIIDKMDYGLAFGPKNNALYYAGTSSWEKWDLSQ